MNHVSQSMLMIVLAIAFALTLTGCVERTINITSEPPGALVYLNDQEIGRTPCSTQFTYYGTYDVRLVLDGYEPHLGPGKAPAPIYQWPVFDFVAEIAPVRFSDTIDWHFDLREANADPAMMLDRARQMRALMRRDLGPPPPMPENDASTEETDTTVEEQGEVETISPTENG